MSASIAPECNEIKECVYTAPYNHWQTKVRKYLRGHHQTNECEELFVKYRTCLTKALKEKGIDTMLDEARKMSVETDTEFLKKS
ncbi:Mitochondrial distribution and morphology protein 35 [Monascus purpureus]|uniref:Mitochondrial distribution and morphology protein 35 n=1 Tax=Monascus purpureus TaxID=5098 RepID=A0A507QZJ5_MONPU|nr:Mitochondrial distribution and morphology protein 35 [Monascus purpureus]